MSIRYYRPQNITYKQTLEDAGIPYYIPTAAELGCSEEILKKIIDPFANNPQIKDAPSPYGDPFQGKLKQWVG